MKQTTFLASLALIATPANAEQMPLVDYLNSIDRTAVTFSGLIKYDRREDDFTFYNEDREPFGVTVDAGRDARERIERECENSSWMISYDDMCTVSGRGTVEIRGSRVYISIEVLDQLAKP